MVTAWLIERTDTHLCYSHARPPRQWVTFTDPLAWRFPNKEAAELEIAARGLTDVVAVEHGWSD